MLRRTSVITSAFTLRRATTTAAANVASVVGTQARTTTAPNSVALIVVAQPTLITSLRRMYLPPRPKPPDPHDELIVNYRSNALFVFIVLVSVIAAIFLFAFTFLVNRFRGDETNTRKGKRVIIIGGSAAGAMAASTITTLDSDVHVTVIEKDRVQQFNGLIPLAAAGHRSYDLRVKGPSSLYASTSWTVTREANLVIAEVKEIDPKKKLVIDDKGVQHPYDALIIAAGCEQDHAIVGGKRLVDSDRVAVSPGGIRDFLSHTATGNVLMVRAPAATEFHRQSEGNWVSTVNTCWKHLDFFGRTSKKGVDSVLSKVWAITPDSTICDALPEAHLAKIGAFWEERGIRLRTGWKLVKVDREKKEATFLIDDEHGKKKTEVVPFRLLIVDLPVKPPSFLTKLQGLTNKQGFVDVDNKTLQHPQYPEIFALGDCAALPVAKSYGAVSAQAPVLAHNVLQFLKHRKCNAEYDLFSSFHINMSTWRCMWPEVIGNKGQRCEPRRGYWDDSEWRGLRGFAQGFFLQMFMYESMYWFGMMRAHWCSPTWFKLPLYEEGDLLKKEVEVVGAQQGLAKSS